MASYNQILKKRIINNSSYQPQWSDDLSKPQINNLFNKATDEWDLISEEDGIGDINFKYEGSDEMCLCTHPIKRKYWVINLKTGDKAHLGSECIVRFGNDNLTSKLKELQKVYCEVCEKSYVNIASHNLSKKHKQNANSKKCIDCGIVIPLLPSWSIRCKRCYYHYKNPF